MKRMLRIYALRYFLPIIFGIAWTGQEARSEPSRLWSDSEIAEADPALDRLSHALARLAGMVQPGVVQIRANRPAASAGDGESRRQGNSRGSGFIINPEGYILTAHHVVEGAEEIEVLLRDRRRLRAHVVTSEPQIDMVLLKINGSGFPALSLGNSDDLKAGELVGSLSYPFGRESALSLGIVSRRGRSPSALAGFDFIQTDASVSAGSSGGPLVNMRGNVVGMITMASQRGNAGFAVPINTIKKILPRLLKGEKIVWGWLGVRVSEVTLERGESLGLSPVRGVFVNSVMPDQPADYGRIRPEDIILAVNGIEVDSPRELTRLIAGTEAGTEVQLTIFRQGKIVQHSVRLGVRPEKTEGREG